MVLKENITLLIFSFVDGYLVLKTRFVFYYITPSKFITLLHYFMKSSSCICTLLVWGTSPLHYVHFVKYDDAVSFYDAVSDTIRRRGGDRGIFTEEGVDTVAYFGGNHGFRV